MYLYPFLVLVSLIGAGYSFWTKQIKIGLGFIVYAAVFFLLIPDLMTGTVSSFLAALALILFVVGTFVICWKKKIKTISSSGANIENKDENETS